MSIHSEGAKFDVICKRCQNKFEVVRNWGGGIRRDGKYNRSNPAKCSCGSMALELF